MVIHKWLTVMLVLAVGSSLITGCSNDFKGNNEVESSNVASKNGGTLSFGSSSDIVTLNPIFVQDMASGDALQWIFAKLFDIDRTGNVIVEPWSLAAEPMIISNDGKDYTIKLKDNVKWSDGEPITADDIIFTFEMIRNPRVGSPAITGFDRVSSIQKLDKQTARISLKETYAPFQYAIASELIPQHILKDVKPEDMQQYIYGRDPGQTVTSGPWKWSEWKPSEYLTFEANPAYWGPKPYINKVTYKIYPDGNSNTQALINGDIDIVAGGVAGDQLEASTVNLDHLSVDSSPGPQYEYIGLNHKSENFKDKWIPWSSQQTRQAMVYALDRQGIADYISNGTGRVIDSPFLPGSWADSSEAAKSYPYDPEKAKKLLMLDGWKIGHDGILTKDGHRFSFELQYAANTNGNQQLSAMIQQNLREVGIEVNPKAMDFPTWVEQNLGLGKFEAILMGWVLNNPDPDQESTFSSKFPPPNGQNIVWYMNLKVDKLLSQGVSTVDQAERARIYKEAALEISTDLPYIFMYQYSIPVAMNKRIKFKEEDKPEVNLAHGYFYHAMNWWIEE